MSASRARAPVQRVLVVEDCPDLGELLSGLLRDQGYDVLHAEDGLDGLELALRERPDAVLSDVGLPGLDGLELAGRLRRNLPEALLVALSGSSRQSAAEDAARAGFDAYLLKPVDFGALLQLLGPPA